MNRVRQVFGGLAALIVLGYAWLLWQNNRASPSPDAAAIGSSYERGVGWLLRHRSTLIALDHPSLWWMIGETARLGRDPRLAQMYREFRARYDRESPRSAWQALLAPDRYRNVSVPATAYGGLVEYQQYFIYASTCAANMADDPLISAQHDAHFCRSRSQLLRQTCTTHQLMGFRLAQRNACAVPDLKSGIGALQATIRRQLQFDPRVVDVYIQRVLMLVESGAPDQVSPRWLTRILDAQLPDGSWDDMHPFVPIGGGRYIGLTSKRLTARAPAGTFHATAQGVWLMALLREQYREAAMREIGYRAADGVSREAGRPQ